VKPGGHRFLLGNSQVAVPMECLDGSAIDTLLSLWPFEPAQGDAPGMPEGSYFGGAVVGDARLPLENAAESLYREIFTRTKDSFLYRIWNYVPAINETPGGVENYRRFCLGRSIAFERFFGPNFHERTPAATAVGCEGGPLIAAFLAGRATPRYLENPRQIPAPRYPSQYGPRAPSFARATSVGSGKRADFFIAGTSAIVGHATVAPRQTAAQLDCTLANLSAISQTCGLGEDLGRHRAEKRHFKVYLRNAADFPAVSSALEARLLVNTDTVSFLRSDLCRSELNIEIEAGILGAHLG
jgi:enamine deaminase RidA (YjgF/YER057c/UK114 family)